MELSENQKREAVRRLLMSRMRLLNTHGFFGLLLMHMQFALQPGLKTAATDGKRILFDPEFLAALSDSELDFVLMHEVMHCALRHTLREGQREHTRFNVACDIVINSMILQENGMELTAITLAKYGVSMHMTPDGREGHEFTAEQVYEMLGKFPEDALPQSWDVHSMWGGEADGEILREVWIKRFADACEAVSVREKELGRGVYPAFAKRIYEKLRKPQTDWRTILNAFVQQEVNDYSFAPPDRRFYDTPFFLPDFNELGDGDEPVDILFMVDTSASVTDREIGMAYREIEGAIQQFGGKLRGWLGFFDAGIIEPVPFETVEDVEDIHPAGGGGTDFGIIFAYVREHMQEQMPACIVIITDGYAPFPAEREAMGIPVLWLINNEDITPPWGRVARITLE